MNLWSSLTPRGAAEAVADTDWPDTEMQLTKTSWPRTVPTHPSPASPGSSFCFPSFFLQKQSLHWDVKMAFRMRVPVFSGKWHWNNLFPFHQHLLMSLAFVVASSQTCVCLHICTAPWEKPVWALIYEASLLMFQQLLSHGLTLHFLNSDFFFCFINQD